MSTGSDETGPVRGSGTPSVIAHRGFAGVYPENTVPAVREATRLETPADTVEVDVMPSADGELVVFHDGTLERLTSAPRSVRDQSVWDLPYETLEQFDVLGTQEPIPRFAEVLEAVPADVRVNVEFKNPGSERLRFAENLQRPERDSARERWLEFAERVVAVVERYPHDVLVSSFFEGALAAVREVAPDLPVAWIFYESVADGLAVSRRYDCEAIHPPWSMFPGTPLFNAEYTGQEPYESVDLVALAEEEGREVNAWTVDTWHQAAELQRAGVDGIIADYPDLFRYAGSGGVERTPRA